MITIRGSRGWLCDTPSRRELLSVGGLSLCGLHLADVVSAKTRVASAERPGFGAARHVIFVYLQGAPSHIDLWDPKPSAPVEIRGEFQAIPTRAPGMFLGEVLPHLAQQADHFSLIRSVGCKPPGLPNHGSAIYMLMTGHDPGNFSPTGLAVPPSREDLPSVGAVVSRFQPAPVSRFGYAAVCGPTREAAVVGLGQGAGLLGPQHDPFTNFEDPTRPINLDVFALPGDVTLDRLRSRVDLGRQLDEAMANVRPSGGQERSTFATQYQQALSLLQRNEAIRAFRLDEEPPTLRERYGWNRFGQSCLLARRLIEAETRFVQVTWPARSDDEPMPGADGSWDTHRNNFPMLRDHRCPVFDRGLAALLGDLHDRGLLTETLVLAVGEFGRSPKIGTATTNNVGPGGRDHWPDCYTALIAGGGVRAGEVFGESDRFAAYPRLNPVHPYDLLSTVFHAVGIDAATEYRDTLNRPRRLVEHGRPLGELF